MMTRVTRFRLITTLSGIASLLVVPSAAADPPPPTPEEILSVSQECAQLPSEAHCCAAGDTVVHGTPQAETLTATGTAPVCIFAAAGNDTVSMSSHSGFAWLSGGNDVFSAQTGTHVVIGGEGADVLQTQSTEGRFLTLDGNDTVFHSGGKAFLDAGPGDDLVYGGGSPDLLHGGDGNDYIAAGSGNDVLDGGEGNDSLYGDGGNDLISGGPGVDLIAGGAGSDDIDGGPGDDSISSSSEDDVVRGGTGRDSISTGSGNDRIIIGSACEVVSGEAIDGGTGTDVIASPFTAAQLAAMGVSVSGIETFELTSLDESACGSFDQASAWTFLSASGSESGLPTVLNGAPVELSATETAIGDLLAAGDFAQLETQYGALSPSVNTDLSIARDEAREGSIGIIDVPDTGGIGDISAGGDPGVPRYSCCDNVDVRSACGVGAGAVVDSLQRSEPVRLLQLVVGPGVSPTSPNTWTNANAYGIVRTRTGVTGAVPAAALFTRPLDLEEDKFVAEIGFGTLANELYTAIEGFLNPQGCQDPGSLIVEGPALYDCRTRQLTSCSGPDAGEQCEGCLEAETTPQGQSDCDDIYQACIQREQDAHFCAEIARNDPACFYADTPDGNPSASCKGVVPSGTSKLFPNPSGYVCGEYPVGITNYECEANEEDKLLHSQVWWGQEHNFTLGRLDEQTAFTFQTHDLTSQSEHSRTSGPALDSRAFWLSMVPRGTQMDVRVCGRLPGIEAHGPNVTYDWWKTFAGWIKRIDYGDAEVDGFDACLYATASLVDADALDEDEHEACFGGNVVHGLRPCLKWVKAYKFDAVNLNVSNVNIQKSWAFYAQFLLGAGAAPFFNLIPVVGDVLMPLVSGALLNGLIAEELLELFAEHYIDETSSENWTLDKLVSETMRLKIFFDFVGPKLTEQTAKAMSADALDLKARLADMCGALIPTTTPADQEHFVLEFLRMHCNAIQGQPGIVPFVPNPRSASNGCYHAERSLFTPADVASAPWWSQFSGQEWFNAGAGNDLGCRFGTEVFGNLDAAVWPIIKCAIAQTNVWVNTGRPGGTTLLQNVIMNNCGASVLDAVGDLYGDLSDVIPDRVQIGGTCALP